MTNSQNLNIVVILNNIRSNENVGSIFRTCDAAGVSKIYLVGITPAPLDRFNRVNPGLAKASLGAENSVEWERVETRLNDEVGQGLKSASIKLKEEGFQIVGVEQDPRSQNYKLLTSKLLASTPKLALVFGNEVDGLSQDDLALCDVVVDIPMRGSKESLNVAVCAGIVLFGLVVD